MPLIYDQVLCFIEKKICNKNQSTPKDINTYHFLMQFSNSTRHLPHKRENTQKKETKKAANRTQFHRDAFI